MARAVTSSNVTVGMAQGNYGMYTNSRPTRFENKTNARATAYELLYVNCYRTSKYLNCYKINNNVRGVRLIRISCILR